MYGKKIVQSKIDRSNKIPIIFHPSYDISFYGIEKLHPFDSKKHGKVFKYLNKKLNIKLLRCFQPEKITDKDLL